MPYDYVNTYTDETGTNCFICYGENDMGDDWMLGDAFLRGYYAVHDHKKKRMGFAPTTDS